MTKVNIAGGINIGITEKHRLATANDLQTLLADEFLLYAKTRSFHWNVEGPHFGALHKLFEDQYRELEEIVDLVAERIRQLGFYADGTFTACHDRTQLHEQSGAGITDTEMLRYLTEDHEAIIKFMRDIIDAVDNDYKDAGTADFLTQLMEKHEKTAWMLRAHISQ